MYIYSVICTAYTVYYSTNNHTKIPLNFPLFQTLSHLDLSDNTLGDQGIIELFTDLSLVLPPHFTSIILQNNNITKASADHIQTLLHSSTCFLTNLDLTRNIICGSRSGQDYNPIHIINLSNAIEIKNRTLISLNLSYIDLGARCTLHLFQALKMNDSLLYLKLQGCRILEQGGIHIG